MPATAADAASATVGILSHFKKAFGNHGHKGFESEQKRPYGLI